MRVGMGRQDRDWIGQMGGMVNGIGACCLMSLLFSSELHAILICCFLLNISIGQLPFFGGAVGPSNNMGDDESGDQCYLKGRWERIQWPAKDKQRDS